MASHPQGCNPHPRCRLHSGAEALPPPRRRRLQQPLLKNKKCKMISSFLIGFQLFNLLVFGKLSFR